MTKGFAWVLAIVVLLVVLLGAKGCTSYNKMVQLEEQVTAQWANVEGAYQRRADLIPTLVGTIKGSANFEQSTLTGVIEARAKATSVSIDASQLNEENLRQFQEAQSALSSSLSRLLVSVERYPDLKTTQQFQDLLAELAGTENRISQERRVYNDRVQDYNTYVRRFPQNIFAGMFGFDRKAPFKADEDANKRVDVDFGNGQ